MLNVNEIFQSIQGEGYHIGKTANFIRLAGCNLNCSYCDTDFKNSNEMSEDEIIEQLDLKKTMIVITGGEPTLQDLEPLIKALRKNPVYIALETNGTNATSHYDLNWVSCSPKPNDYKIHPHCIPCELKYVVSEDLRFSYIQKHRVPLGHVFLQIESCKPESIKKAMNLTVMDPSLRIGVQAHKYLNVD
jgi:7-carboxy-7-deazaguanine synthase